VFARVLLRLVLNSSVATTDLFGGTAAGFDAGTGRSKQRSCGADHSKDSGWIFGRISAAILCVQRVDYEKEKS
jgi:hypothetical protein